MHLRPLPDDHRGAFRERVDYGFRPEDGPDWEGCDRDALDLFTALDAPFPRERVFFGEGF